MNFVIAESSAFHYHEILCFLMRKGEGGTLVSGEGRGKGPEVANRRGGREASAARSYLGDSNNALDF